MELLARIVEEVSILAAERRRNEPVTVPRPAHVREQGKPKVMWGTPLDQQGEQAAPVPAPEPEVHVEPEGADPSFARAIGALAGSAIPGSRVRYTGGEPA